MQQVTDKQTLNSSIKQKTDELPDNSQWIVQIGKIAKTRIRGCPWLKQGN